jgi:predicted transcriptional regulator
LSIQQDKPSQLLQRLKKELGLRHGDFPEIAAKANVDVGWLYSVTKKSNPERDHGVKRVEQVLEALGVKVSMND